MAEGVGEEGVMVLCRVVKEVLPEAVTLEQR